MKNTGKNSPQEILDGPAIEQALGWVVRLRSERVTEADIEAFADWLIASDQHKLAWSQALDTWETAGVLSYMPDLLPEAELQAAAPFHHSLFKLLRRGFAGFWRSLTTVTASLAVVALAVLIFQDNGQTYSSAVGEYKQVRLEDGSLIELNTHSSVMVSFSDSLREIELVRGEAFFTVASNKAKPFIVRVGGADVQALGTAFNVYRQSADSAKVHVIEGVVRVSETEGSAVSAPESKMLVADQALEFSGTTGLTELPDQNLQQATAWREGQILFTSASLDEAMRVVNRYLEHKLVLGDGVQSAHKVSGIFSSRERETTLMALAQAFDLELTRQANNWLLSKPNP